MMVGAAPLPAGPAYRAASGSALVLATRPSCGALLPATFLRGSQLALVPSGRDPALYESTHQVQLRAHFWVTLSARVRALLALCV